MVAIRALMRGVARLATQLVMEAQNRFRRTEHLEEKMTGLNLTDEVRGGMPACGVCCCLCC